MLADNKVIAWLMKGSVEYNKITRDIDLKILSEALEEDYRIILKLIQEYFTRYKTPPTYDILTEYLVQDQNTLYLLSMIEEEPVEEAEILFYLDEIRKRYNAELAEQFTNSIANNAENIDIQEFNSNLVKIAAKVERLKKSSVFAEGYFDKTVDERYNDYIYTEENPEHSMGVMSGFPELDHFTYGLKKSELMLFAGASSSGKSLLMLNYAVNSWLGSNKPLDQFNTRLQDGKNILYFTLEMSKKQLEQRMDANMADIRHRAVVRGLLTIDEKQRWKSSLNFQRDYDKKFYIVDMPRGSRTIDIEARYESIVAEFEPDLVVVDYLGIMKPNHETGQDWLEVGQVAADLHEFCRSKNVAVLSAAQLKAKNKANKDQSLDIESLGRSKIIGDNANIIMMIENREDEKLREDSIIHVVKNRDGERGTFRLFKEFEKSKFVSIPDNWTNNMGDENAI